VIDEGVYETIYNNASNIRGYTRYALMAKQVTQKSDPLGFLSRSEDVYWFIFDYLEKNGVPKSAKILEVGSGLGYLTYAIHKRGYENIVGLDISTEAVRRATNSYGDYYRAADLIEYSKITRERFDLIIMTEVIEHLADPLSMLRAMRSLLRDDGTILLSTPNKSDHPAAAYWKTDNPPVHLWWFSESSMRQMAIREKLEVSFWDFSEFRAARVFGIRRPDPCKIVPIMPAYIDDDGTILAHPVIRTSEGVLRSYLERKLGEYTFWRIKRFLLKPIVSFRFYKSMRKQVGSRSGSMGVLLRLPTDRSE
jgi:2-polyprenyl-3-methyl-5-hydroxy-6-metoxy-1,4-benzoquinol methylase